MLFLVSAARCMLLASCLFVCLRRFCLLLAGVRPAGEVLFLATKKSTQKKVALLTASLRFAAGNLWCSGMGCTAKLTTRQGAPFKQTR
jgi:hypothetical protein